MVVPPLSPSHLRSAHEMTLLTTASGRRFNFAYCGGIFIASTLAVLPFVRVFVLPEEDDYNVQVSWLAFRGKSTLPNLTSLAPWVLTSLLLAGALFLLVSVQLSKTLEKLRLMSVPVALLAVGAGQAFGLPGVNRVEVYGDFIGLKSYLDDPDVVFGRWLLGLTVLREVYQGVNSFLFAMDSGRFVDFASALVMFASTLWLWTRREHSIVPWVLMISPMWMLFSLGYSEYYPFVAGILVIASWQVISNEQFFQQRTTYVLAGVFPILYIGALPVSVALLLHAWSHESDFRTRLRGALTALIAMVLAIELGGEFKGYVSNLAETMNLGGELVTESREAAVTALSSRSFLASPSYALSVGHLVDIWFWMSCGIGLVVLFTTLLLSRRTSQDDRLSPLQSRSISLKLQRAAVVVLMVLAVFYLLFMLPLLGPTRDIDLYFVSMFVLLIFAADRFDRVMRISENPSLERLRFMQLTACGFAPAATALILFGVSR